MNTFVPKTAKENNDENDKKIIIRPIGMDDSDG